MSVTNPWLNPYQRSYQQIKSKLIEGLKNIKDSHGNTLITDYSEGNILVLIISMFSAIAEVIHYYIDNMARETFFSTSRKYDSLVKHGELVDYHTRASVASTVDVQLSRPLTSDYISAEILISKDLQFTDNSGNTWLVTKDTKWYSNVTSVSIPLIQHVYYEDNRMVGIVIPNPRPTNKDIRINVPSLGNGSFYEDGTMSLEINNEDWVLVNTFAFSGKFDKHFRIEVDIEHNINILFGDGEHGMIPDPGYQITSCGYFITKGSVGNVSEGSIVNIPLSIKQSISDAVCTNPYKAAGGSDYESFDMLKKHIPLHVRTLGVAVTKQDFVDMALQVNGVGKCVADYECGRKLNLYIAPEGGSIASTNLCDEVYDYLSKRCPLTTWLRVQSVGITEICLDIDVTGRRSFSTEDIYNQILSALLDRYSPDNSEIGGQIRISDIYALIDNLPMVDYLHINKFYIKPWPITIYGNKQLKIGQFVLNQVKGITTYFISFTSSSSFELKSNINGFVQLNLTVGTVITINDTNNGNIFNFSIVDNGYSTGYKYSISISEPNGDYIEPGFNLPVFDDPTKLTLTVHEVL